MNTLTVATAAVAVAAVLSNAVALPTTEPRLLGDTSHIKKVHVVQTCHLDVGFAKTAAGELENYRGYLVNAASIADDFRKNPGKHGEGLVFTTHPYIVSLLLDCPPGMGFECPTSDEQDTIRKALKQGDIVMQAFPFNAETATLTPRLFTSALQLAKNLSSSLGIAAPLTMTQRDVPGVTQGAIPLLQQSGIKYVSVGVNTASLPPSVPRAFRWTTPDGNNSVLASWHPHGYGGIDVTDCIVLDNLDEALCPDYKGDNQGPWSRDEIESHWTTLMKEFPQASIVPSSFDQFYPKLESVASSLPVVSTDLADSWIYGVPSDPKKNLYFREIMRTADECYSSGTCQPEDRRLLNFTRLVVKNSEHTWGCDIKTYLHDEKNWTNDMFHPIQFTASNYQFVTNSWREQRDWGLTYALQALEDHPLAATIKSRLDALSPHSAPSSQGYTEADVSSTYTVGKVKIGFDSDSGAISLLTTSSGNTIASATNMLGRFVYQKHSAQQYNTFFDEYAQRIDGKIPSYFPKDFGKPGLYDNPIIAVPDNTTASVDAFFIKQRSSTSTSFLLNLSIKNTSFVNEFGAPQSIVVQVDVEANEAAHVTNAASGVNLNFTYYLVNKTATRLPESLWVEFTPISSADMVYSMDKLALLDIDPLKVNVNASRHLHSIGHGVKMAKPNGSLQIKLDSPDTPVVSWGSTSPFPTPSGNWQPDLSKGAAFCLFNNIWGTNYIMWYPFEKDEVIPLHRFWLTVSD